MEEILNPYEVGLLCGRANIYFKQDRRKENVYSFRFEIWIPFDKFISSDIRIALKKLKENGFNIRVSSKETGIKNQSHRYSLNKKSDVARLIKLFDRVYPRNALMKRWNILKSAYPEVYKKHYAVYFE